MFAKPAREIELSLELQPPLVVVAEVRVSRTYARDHL